MVATPDRVEGPNREDSTALGGLAASDTEIGPRGSVLGDDSDEFQEVGTHALADLTDDDDDADFEAALEELREEEEEDSDDEDSSEDEGDDDTSDPMALIVQRVVQQSRFGFGMDLDGNVHFHPMPMYLQPDEVPRSIKQRYERRDRMARPYLSTSLAHELERDTSATRDQWALPHCANSSRLIADLSRCKKRSRIQAAASTSTSGDAANSPSSRPGAEASSTTPAASSSSSAHATRSSSARNRLPAAGRNTGVNEGEPGSGAGHVVQTHPNMMHLLNSRETGRTGNSGNNCLSPSQQRHISGMHYPPAHLNRAIDRRYDQCYIGQFSRDGTIFLAAYKDKRIILYDVENGYKVRKDVEARDVHWTITDTCTSPDGRFLLYSTISPIVNLVNVEGTRDVVHSIANVTEIHESLNFSRGESDYRRWGIWSLDWSSDSKEVVAGTNESSVVIFDIETERPKCSACFHDDDVNAVAFVDAACNVVVSGSDDTTLLISDRRTMSRARRPEGVFSGHTEGITHIDSKGDGVHIISNSKDSTIKMWDMRKLGPASLLSTLPRTGLLDFDYRFKAYPGRNYHITRDVDHSVMTFWGHSVLRTLIRAYWSPPSTGQRYIYSGSADGCIYMFDTITGEVKHKLKGHQKTVRDCSWHPHNGTLVSVSWDGSILEWGPRPCDGPPAHCTGRSHYRHL